MHHLYPPSPYESYSTFESSAIPTIVDGGNHTLGFTASAKTTAAHYATLDVSKALAATGVRVVLDDEFNAKVQASFKEDQQLRGQL